MRSWAIAVASTAALVFGCLAPAFVSAAVTPAQRKEIADVKKELGKVNGLISKKQLDEARKILDESEEKLKQIATAASIPENDKLLASSFNLIALKRNVLDKKGGKDGGGAGGGSFAKDVGPLLAAKCGNCHNEDRTSGGLRLDTFAGLKAGGTNGALLTPGNAQGSLLIARVTASGNGRMPKGQAPLSATEINTLATWVNQGAKFDGEDENAKLSPRDTTTKPAGDGKPTPIVKATGNEKVLFTRDIAPFMANLCGGCHGGNNPRGGLSLVNFEGLMKGGQSGRVILPGNLEGSRLWRLVGGLEAPRMPQGQARITRKNYEDLKTWLEEGAKFDGPDPKAPLRSFVKSEEQVLAEQLAKLTPEEFVERRLEKSKEQWKRANPKEEATLVEGEDFFVYGNPGEARLKEVAGWADEHIKTLRSAFNLKTDRIWKGKLAIFVFKDRFSYEEFPRVIEMAEVPPETIGHSRVTASFDEAYICLEDVGDEATAESPGLRISLIDHLTGAYLKRTGGEMPDWLIRGTGLALAARTDKKNPYIAGMHAAAIESLKGVASPAEVFANGTFSSADLGPVGYTLVEHMLKSGAPQFSKFVQQLQSGSDLTAALRSVYNADTNALATSYYAALGASRKGRGKK